MSEETDYHHKLQFEFATKLQPIEDEAAHRLSVMGWFLLMSAICSLGETSKTVFPALSHSHTKIRELGPTYKESLNRLPKHEQDTIQELYRRFVDSLSYGKPNPLYLKD